MTKAIEKYIRSITPPSYDRTVVSERRELIQSLLSNPEIDGDFLFESGSWSHGTGIAKKADVDYMSWISTVRPEKSYTSLSKVHRAIEGKHWSIVGATISRPVVQVRFVTPPHLEIAPAYYIRKSGDYNVFLIPGPDDGWAESAPQAHLRYVTEINKQHSGKVKNLIRLFKAWKHAQNVPVSSFYLEMQIARYAANQSSIYWDLDLRYGMRYLLRSGLSDINDPQGIVGRISACNSQADKAVATTALKNAVDHIDAASDYSDGVGLNYWVEMSQVFGLDFPLVL